MEKWTSGAEDGEYYMHLCLWEPENDSEVYEITEFLYAPGKGDQIFREMIDQIQSIANQKGITILHKYQATNTPALNLIERNLGYADYQFAGSKNVDGGTWYVYTKIYTPES